MQPDKSYSSPNGRYRLEIFSHEVRKSQWIDCPYLYDLQTEQYIFSAGQLWHATNITWQQEGNRLNLDLLHYGMAHFPITVIMDLEKDRAAISVPGYNIISSGTLDTVGGELSNSTEYRLLFY